MSPHHLWSFFFFFRGQGNVLENIFHVWEKNKWWSSRHLIKETSIFFLAAYSLISVHTKVSLSTMHTPIWLSSHTTGAYGLIFSFQETWLLSYRMISSLFSSNKVGGTVDTTTCMSSALTTETWVSKWDRVGNKDQEIEKKRRQEIKINCD